MSFSAACLADPPFKSECGACAVRSQAICADLDEGELAALNRIGRGRFLAAGERLQWEGDEPVVVANVLGGVLKLSSGRADGSEQILGLAFPSDFVGRPFGTSAPFDIEALTDAQVCAFHGPDFDRFAREHPRLQGKLLNRTLSELDRAHRWMLLLGRMSAEQKLASFLIDLAERLGVKGTDRAKPVTLTLPLSRQQIADVLGLTIETVSRQFTHLRREGLIDTPSRRDVVILDRDGLAAAAG